MAATSMGEFKARITVDVSDAISAYTQARQAHVSMVTALNVGAGALATTGAVVAGVGAGMVASLLDAALAAGEFERKLDFFGAVSGATVDQMEAVRLKALELNRDTIYTADEIGDAFTELAKAGQTAGNILAGVGEAVILLGSATDIPLTDAALSLTTILNTFAISAEGAVGVVDKLAGAANASSIDVQDLILTMTYAGASAKVAGLEFDDVNTAIAYLGKVGIRGSKAGTGLRQMFDKLIAPTNKGKDALASLGLVAEDGSNALLEMDGTLKPIPQLLDALNGPLSKLTAAEKMDVLGQIFPITSLPTILSLLEGGSAALADLNVEIGKTSAADVASERLDNLSGDIEYLKSSAENLQIIIGQLQQGMMRGLVQAITAVLDWLSRLDPVVLNIIVTMAQFAAGLLVIFGVAAIFSGALLQIISVTRVLMDIFPLLAKVLTVLAGPIRLVMAALFGNPFGILITIILALAGALLFFFTQTETGRAIWEQLMNTFQNALVVIGPLLAQFAEVLGGLLMSGLQVVLPILLAVANVLMAVIGPILPIITEALAGVAEAFSGIGTSASGFQAIADIIGQVFTAIATALPIIILALVNIITTLIITIVGMLPDLVAGAITLFMGLLTALITVLPQLITGLVTALTTLITAVIGLIPVLIQAALTLFQAIVTGLLLALPLILQGITQLAIALVMALVQAIPLLLIAAVELFKSIVAAIPVVIPLLIEGIIQLILGVIMATVEAIPLLLQAAIDLFMALVDALVEIIPMVITTTIELIPVIIAALISLIPVLLEGCITLFMALVEAIPEIIPPLIDAVMELGPTIVDTLIEMGPQLQEAGERIFAKIQDAVQNSIPGIVGKLGDMGRRMIEGLVNGIKNMAQSVVNAVSNVVGGAIEWAKSLLDQHSPSRVFDDIGMNTILGLINGILGMTRPLNSAMGMIQNNIDDFYDQVYAAREMDVMMNLESQMGVNAFSSTQADQLALLNEKLSALMEKDTINIEHYEVINPEPEPESESLPNAIRKAAYMVG